VKRIPRPPAYPRQAAWEWWGALAVVCAGGILHFAYPWSGSSPVVGLFAPVNESVWEHLKLGLWPLGLLTVVEYAAAARKRRSFFPARLAGIACLMVFIVGFYYLYTPIAGTHVLFLDIGSFVVGVVLCQMASAAIMRCTQGSAAGSALGAAGIAALAALFAVLSFFPPLWDPFRDPPTGAYGPVAGPVRWTE
jgi:hypothetical protein